MLSFFAKYHVVFGNNQYLYIKYQVKSVEMKRINRLKVVLVENVETFDKIANLLNVDMKERFYDSSGYIAQIP
ncbi:hypothetical protein DWW88_05195 [Bacteroides cellulosilyticus]|nr:hypothetical protein DWW88_05195 [Bacteroides cellulosilyticus]